LQQLALDDVLVTRQQHPQEQTIEHNIDHFVPEKHESQDNPEKCLVLNLWLLGCKGPVFVGRM
jgi:hypothetical protein